MKNIFIFITLILSFLIVSCSSEDNPVGAIEPSYQEPSKCFFKTKLNDTLWCNFDPFLNTKIGYVDAINCDSILIKFSYRTNCISLPNAFFEGVISDSLNLGIHYDFYSEVTQQNPNLRYFKGIYRAYNCNAELYLFLRTSHIPQPYFFVLDSIWFYK